MQASYAKAAFVEKAFGLEGDVVVRWTVGVSFSVAEHVALHVVPPADPNDAPRVLHVERCDARPGEETARVHFAELSDPRAAELLAGRWLLASCADIEACEGACDCGSALSPSPDGVDEAPLTTAGPSASVVGCEVYDERWGLLGRVKETIETPANEVWVVDGPLDEVLVPVVGQCCRTTAPDANGRLFTHLIDGLVDEGRAAAAGVPAETPAAALASTALAADTPSPLALDEGAQQDTPADEGRRP